MLTIQVIDDRTTHRDVRARWKGALETGAFAHFLKPFNIDEFIGAVHQVMGMSNGSGAQQPCKPNP